MKPLFRQTPVETIKKSADFKKVYAGKKRNLNVLSVHFISLSPSGASKSRALRVGYTVSKKRAKKATVRNSIKRRMKEAVRRNIGKNKFNGHLVITALKNIACSDSYAAIEADIIKAFDFVRYCVRQEKKEHRD